MIKHVYEQIKDADMVLVGLGEDMDLLNTVKSQPKYLEIKNRTKDEAVLSFAERQLISEMQEKELSVCQQLSECIRGKNYFIVSLCLDNGIEHVDLNPERIVRPCGGFGMLQCPDGCTGKLYNVSRELEDSFKSYMDGTMSENKIEFPVCPVCGKKLVFNNVTAPCYIEEGYLQQWKIYTKWLQGTVNRKLCILELGMGMKYPTVARWPFEKVTFFNQKAELFRVHERLYQISEEIKERGHGICQNPADFLKELSNQC